MSLNTSWWQINSCLQVGRQVVRHLALRVLGNCCENLCLSYRIVLGRNKLREFNQISLVCNLLRRQNSIAKTKIFTKILQHTRAICSCNFSPRRVATTGVCVCVCVCAFRTLEAEAARKNAWPKPETAHEKSLAPRVAITSFNILQFR